MIQTDIKSFINHMNLSQLEEMSALIFEQMLLQQEFENEDEMAYNNIVCPECDSINYVKNGKVRGKQRFLFRECKRTFGVNSQTIISKSKLENETWKKYIQCMINGYSIRKSTEIAEVCVKTSFYMRHKILEANKSEFEKYTGSIESNPLIVV